MKNRRLALTSACSTIAIICLAVPAHAQTTAPAPKDAGSADSGEIVVTANKRSENLSKVGMSITAISGAALQERKITSLQDLASIVPGLQFASSTSNTPIFTLRGIGFNENSLGVYPAVSVYLDQAPLPFPVLASHTAFDLERVEVLKGPQGTLFGQNSTGGAINYIAAKPTSTFQSGGDISYGRFNQVSGNAYLSGPLSDTLKGRVAVTGLRQDAWQRSVTRPGDTNGKQKYYAGRVLLDWAPTDTIKLALNVNGWVDKSDPQALQLIAKHPVTFPPATTPGFLAAPFVTGNARLADWTATILDPATNTIADFSPFSDRKFYQLALRADVKLSADLTLTALTTYDHFTQKQSTDGDGLALNNFDLPSNDGQLKSFNQEMRLANGQSNSFRWILGANYEHSTTAEYQDDRYIDNTARAFGINGSQDQNNQKIDNYAAFASAEYSATDKLTLLGGLRYTDSKISDYNCGYAGPGTGVNDLFNYLGSVLGGPPFTPIGTGPGQCYTLNENLVPGQAFTDTLHEHNLSWRAGANYQATSATLLYANVSRGYKAGSYPSLAAASYRSLRPVTQEVVTAYEAGLKTSMLNRMVALNAAAFYYDYGDKQIRGRVIDFPNLFGPIDALVNIPKSRIWGSEVELTVRPTPGLTLSGNVTYLNSKILNFTGNDINGGFGSFGGDKLPFTPRWSGNFNVDYRLPLANGTPFLGVTVAARGKSDATLAGERLVFPIGDLNSSIAPGVGNPYVIKSYTTVDGRVGYESRSGWKAYVWGRNILNQYYYTNAIAAAETITRTAGMPATYGVTLAVNFK